MAMKGYAAMSPAFPRSQNQTADPRDDHRKPKLPQRGKRRSRRRARRR